MSEGRTDTFQSPVHLSVSSAAESVRAACLDAATRAYEDAGIRGLCPEGRWEAAIAAVRHLDISHVIEPPAGSGPADPSS
jgi:hypothetical protein